MVNNFPEIYKKLVVNKYNNKSKNTTINDLLNTYDIFKGLMTFSLTR